MIPASRKPKFLSDIFFLPEEISLPAMTRGKFAEIHGGLYPAFDPARFSEFLEKFEIDADHNTSRMSAGQKKKAMISFALATNTRYLLLDEPTGGMDITSKAAFRSMGFRKRQVLIFLLILLSVVIFHNAGMQILMSNLAHIPAGTRLSPGIMIFFDPGFGYTGSSGNRAVSEYFPFIRLIRYLNSLIWLVVFSLLYLTAWHKHKEHEL